MTALQGPIKLRRGTANDWTSANPVLALGEPGFETDTGIVKYGDGTTPWASLPYPPIFVAAPGGSDDTSKLAAAEARLPSTGGTIRMRAGTYTLPTGYTFSKPVRLIGEGMGDVYGWTSGGGWPARTTVRGLTTLLIPAPNGIVLNSQGSSISDLAIVNSVTAAPTSGTGLLVNAGHQFHADRVAVVGFFDNLSITEGAMWVVRDCYIKDHAEYGIALDNSATLSDEGDNTITGCTIVVPITSPQATAAVHWSSGGGLRFNNNKINGNHLSGIHLSPYDGVNTSVMLIENNSIESSASNTVAVNLKRPTGGTNGLLAGIEILGNETNCQYGVLCQSAGFTGIDVSRNVFMGGGITNGVSFTYGTEISVGPNTFVGTPAGAAINIGSNVSQPVNVAPQTMASGNSIVVTDSTIGAQAAGVDYRYRRTLPTITTTATKLYRCQVGVLSCGVLRVRLSGQANGVGGFAIEAVRSYTRGSSGNASVATVGTDTMVGAATTDALLGFDVTSVAGEVGITLALTAGHTATNLVGICEIEVNGRLTQFRIGT